MMGTKTLKGKFLPQYRTAAQWSAADTVLLRGELGIESDTRKFKFGDGATAWKSLKYAQSGSGADSAKVINISDAESISKAVTSVTWKEVGQIYPVIICYPEGVTGLPDDIPADCNLVGTVQKVDDGTVTAEDAYIVTLNIVQQDNALSGVWYQILLNNAGDVLEEKKYSLGGNSGESLPFDGPIPGYELVSANAPDMPIASGAEVTVNFDKALPLSQVLGSKARFFFDATIVSVSGSTTSEIATIPITIFRPRLTGPVFEYLIQSISTGTNFGRIRLIITSWIKETGENSGVTGCNLMMQCNNINPSITYKLVFNGLYAKSWGGVATPDKYYLTIDGKTATGENFEYIDRSTDSPAKLLPLPFSTNGTPKIIAKTGEFISAEIVYDISKGPTTIKSGNIQIAISKNTELLRRTGSVMIALEENDIVQCAVMIAQSSGESFEPIRP